MSLEKLDANASNVRLYSSEFEGATPVPTQAQLQANYQSADLTNSGGRGLFLHLKLANSHGSPTYRIKVLWKTPSGSYFGYYQTSTYGANGDYWFSFYSGPAGSGGNFTESAQGLPLAGNWAILVVYGGTPGTDYADVTVETQIVQ